MKLTTDYFEDQDLMKLDVTSDKRVMVVPVFLVVLSQFTPKENNDGGTTCHGILVDALTALISVRSTKQHRG